MDVPGKKDEATYRAEQVYTFKDGLHKDFQWLRTPEPDGIFRCEDGRLVLTGRESIGSGFEQAFVARRQVHFWYDAETVVDFSPEDERQFAGLTAHCSCNNFFCLVVTAGSDGQRELLSLTSVAASPDVNLATQAVAIPNDGKVKLKLMIGGEKLQFYYALGEDRLSEMIAIGPKLDASILSDECGGTGSTGASLGPSWGWLVLI